MSKRYKSALTLPALAAALAPTAFAQPADYNALPGKYGLVPQPDGTAATLADLDGDGILDVLGLRHEGPGESVGSNWSFFYQRGLGGEFGPVVANPFDLGTWSDVDGSPSYAPTLSLGDVDGDGDLDLFTSGPSFEVDTPPVPTKLASLYYWENVGTDTEPSFAAPVENPFGLTPAPVFPSTGFAAHPALHDLDGDGDVDLIVVAPTSTTVYLNSGTNPPQFTPVDGNFGLSSLSDQIRGITLFDADGDGDADLVTTEVSGRVACQYDTSGEGELPAFGMAENCLAERSYLTTTMTSLRPHTLSFGNLDADAEAEALVFFAGQMFVMQPQDGFYTPDAYDPFALSIVGGTVPMVPRARDFDRDGDVDVLVVDRGSTEPVRYLERIDATRTRTTRDPFSLSGTFGFSGIDFADLDGDGRFDAVGASETFVGNLAVFYDQNESGAPLFDAPQPLTTDLAASGRYYPALGDLDADGDADLVLGGPTGGLIVMLNTPDDDGLPIFATTPAEGLATIAAEASPSLYDFDGDGDADLYVGQADGTVLIFRNDTPPGGALTFTQIDTPEGVVTAGYATVEPADVDGDGDADLIIGELVRSVQGDQLIPAPTLRLLVAGTTPLPVELTAFTGTLDGSRVVLRWETASETNNAGFDVEHRQGTQPFRTLGFVPGGGTTLEASTYTFTAADLPPGTHVFRLRQVDFDGAFAFSPEVELTLRADGLALTILGNPSREAIRGTLALPQEAARLTLFDVLGRKVLVQEVTSGAFSLDASGLSSGVYVLRVEAGPQTIIRQIVVAR